MTLGQNDRVDWKIDRTTWDVVVPLEPVSGAEGVAQRIAILLKMIRGEWFANRIKGMPWFTGQGVDENTAILGQPFVEVRTRAEVRKIILSVEGVAVIESLTVAFDRLTRKVRIRWRCTTIWGDTAEGELDRLLAGNAP